MMPMASTLSADDMADLGAYFDSLTNTGLEADPSYWQAGEKLYRGGDRGARNSGVHGLPWPDRPRQRTGEISGAARPTIGLRRSKQLNDYASGTRTTGPNGIMQTIAKRLSPEDIRNLASYLQGIR